MKINIGPRKQDNIYELRRVAGIPRVVGYVVKPRLKDIQTCQREGWDDEGRQFEKCGRIFKSLGCDCHPKFCPDCSAETHGISLILPAVLERSPLENHCSSKGNW